jgi:hypothetical protein
MKLYEIINPSDCVTFHAPDDATAVAVVLSIGEGSYGATRCEDGQDVGGLLLFATNAVVDAKLQEWFGGDFETWANSHQADLAEALLDCAAVRPETRDLYDEACARRDSEEELMEFRAQAEDKNRSSMTNIVGRAWVLGKALRRKV